MFDNARPLHPDPHNKPEPEPPAETGYRPHMHVVPGLPEAEDVLYAPPAPPLRTWPEGFQRSAPAGPDAASGAWSAGAGSLTPAVGHTPPPTPANGSPVPPAAAHANGLLNGASRHAGSRDGMFTVPPTASVSANGVGTVSRRPSPAGQAPVTTTTTKPPRNPSGEPVVDPAVVRILKDRAAEQLHEFDKMSPGLTHEDREQRGRAIVAQVVAEWADITARERGISTTPAEDRAMARAVWDWLFRAGPLEPYLTDPAVENILVNGYDTVWVDYADRPRVQVPPLTASDEELRELLRDLARRHGSGERTLSTAQPTLALRLPDGSRLQAITEVTPHTYVTIRRHRVRDVRLADLIGLGTLDRTLAAFLGSLVRAKKNLIICGTQGVGKTSLLRALSHEIPRDERIGTFETELELFLHELGHLRQVVAIEAREGNGERGIDGKSAGELTIGELIPSALRMSLSRMIVGEVRSSEIVPMLRVMTNGEGGSMCTLHVREPDMIFDRIAELCLEYGAHMSPELAYRLASNAVDYVVFVRMIDETAIGGKRHRFVSHVLEVTGMGEHRRPAVNTIFAPTGDDPRGMARMYPSDMPDLIRAGFSPHLLDEPHGWRPLQLKLHQAG
ncbi:CpaF family protein [Embleya scabrispora]|uniref:CpaF family protein n=1 Tax=Embleya scabrispora TaxID=159449 RepID=UPI00036979BC|nr:ATPase, T2SS/T4P/T4SS family [Embleya scabrispora]